MITMRITHTASSYLILSNYCSYGRRLEVGRNETEAAAVDLVVVVVAAQHVWVKVIFSRTPSMVVYRKYVPAGSGWVLRDTSPVAVMSPHK
jgi:hypothetical protein